MKIFKCSILFVCGLLIVGCEALALVSNTPDRCVMQAWHREIDALPDPPYRETNYTGDAYVLFGMVRDANTCAPIVNATVMFDMTNAAGEYDGVQRGTTYTNALGFFTIRSRRPGAYGGGPPHIHLFVGTAGYTPITVAHNLTGADTQAQITITLNQHDDSS